MKLFSAFEISGSGLSAQRLRMDTIANNIANVNTTRSADGGPYRRQRVIFEPRKQEAFFLLPNGKTAGGTQGGVKVTGVVPDTAPAKIIYDPAHPDANEKGYVAMPNINLVNEMVDMISATRAYEANVQAINNAKSMALKALEIGQA